MLELNNALRFHLPPARSQPDIQRQNPEREIPPHAPPIQTFRIQTKPLNQCTKTILHSRDSASIFLMSIFSGLCVIIHNKNTKFPRPAQLRAIASTQVLTIKRLIPVFAPNSKKDNTYQKRCRYKTQQKPKHRISISSLCHNSNQHIHPHIYAKHYQQNNNHSY